MDTSEAVAPAAAAAAAAVAAAAASPVAPKVEPTAASAAPVPAAAAGSDVATSMEVDTEADGATGVKVEPSPADSLATEQTVAASAEPGAAASSLVVSLSAISSPPASASAAAAPASSPSAPEGSPRASPQPVLLPPPPPIELDSARLASLPGDLASLLHGCSVEQAEQTAFQFIKIAVEYQMKPDRNQAMDAMIKIAKDNKP